MAESGGMESVRISVKAPNQKMPDQKFTVNMGYTVKKFKTHLQLHYPGNPEPTEQRLIYMGKLLVDSSLLQDILKPDLQTTEGCHTFHLVCSSSDNGPKLTKKVKNEESNVSTASQKLDLPSSENVERTSEEFVPMTTPFVQPSHSMNMPLATSSVPTMVPGMPYTPEQMIWLQQVYTQQMANYMHLMYQGYPYGHPEHTTGHEAADANHPMPAAAAPRPAQNNNQQQQMVMNAAGGQAVFEDEEEDLNRDWLDWSYIMCRFAVLLAIVYFYSTLGRFFMVFGFFFMIYLYQNGWFRLNRRVVRPDNRPQQRPPQDIQPEENHAEGTDETTEDTAEDANIEPVPEGPGILKVILSFFVTFFTSLIPQQPGQVNAN